ncbi:MAG: hypothetical protein N2053_08035 [Chitinispirillaceae bacterium]|nr:hypothetical protein [Chitinispirillaceae bacterium]
MLKKSWLVVLVLSFPYFLFGDTIKNEDITVKQHAYGSIELGQIARGHYKQGVGDFNRVISKIWQQRAFANIGLNAFYKDMLALEFVGEGMVAFSTPQLGPDPITLQPRHSFYIKSSNAKINIGDPSFLSGLIQVGYFPFKYNREVKNLGEYLFRSMPYPVIIYADFDYPMANLLGARINFNGFNKLFSNDFLIHSELITIPVQNWSISDIAEVNLFNNAFNLGAGVSLYHWLNVYQGEYMERTLEKYYYPENLPDNISKTYSDTMLDNHKAIKLMFKTMIDPKVIIEKALRGGSTLPYFNRNDLKLYAEIDIIGLKNYPIYYEKIEDRIFYTLGFNLPGFFVMDLINIEVEYCTNQSAFSDEFFTVDRPSWEPVFIGFDENGDTLRRSPIRWSVYLKKSLFNEHLSFILQLARDHKKINFYYFKKEAMSFRETLPHEKDWWWVFKTEFKF